ncbi:MAG: transglutaminase domain-containing protein [Lachnospiraceae bacterium]
MKELHFVYYMDFNFDHCVEEHSYSIKCIPKSDEKQDISNISITIEPQERYTESQDSFQNKMIFGKIEKPHDYFRVTISGKAVTNAANILPGELPHKLGVYRTQSAYTKPGTGIMTLHDEICACAGTENGENKHQYIPAVMDTLKNRFTYQKLVTDVNTTAEEAWNNGAGVCQDYAHIMLSLLRMENIPCRYVVGMMLGEGYSHAWVEVWENGIWNGYDPTNHLLVNDDYIKISVGRDYHDTIVSKGVFKGNAGQKQTISVKVEEHCDKDSMQGGTAD